MVDNILLERTVFTVNNTSHCTHRSFNLLANIFCGQLNAISVGRFYRRFDCLDRIVEQFGDLVDSRFERDEIGRWHIIVNRDSQLFVGKLAFHKMLFMRLKRPRLNFFDKVRHVRQHLENHRDVVETIQIIGRQKALFIDISASDACLHLLNASCRGKCLVHQIQIFPPILQTESSNQAITNMRKLITGTQSVPSFL